EWDVWKTFETEETPLDVAATARLLFVLTDRGQVFIYSPNGELMGKIPVGNTIDRIDTIPGGNALFLSSRIDKKIKILRLDFIQQINTLGPFKGTVESPVVIAVFSDFQ
ncbi:MAG: hypothetical protein ACYS0I_21225, partial [Planctomycetota bacterium]